MSGIPITHAERVIFPGTRLTKGDLARYYEAVAPFLLPHVRGRPLSTLRCPEGLAGSCFFQKHWSATGRDGHADVRTFPVPEDSGETLPYAIVTHVEDLITLVQQGMIEAHMWGSRVDMIERPDRLVIDLDPGTGVGWRDVVRSAHEVRALLGEVGLESWVKLTGGKGVHVTVPVQRHVEWDVLAAFAKAVAQCLTRRAPERYVAKASKTARVNRIFVDWLRNTRGATSVAPWSVRAREGATVSWPLPWSALDEVKNPARFTMTTVLALVSERYQDPWRDLLTSRQRLTPAMTEQLLV